MPDFSIFARHKRTQSDFTIAECAQSIGFTPDAYLKKERGERGWSVADMMKLATLYGVSPARLMVEFEDWQKEQPPNIIYRRT